MILRSKALMAVTLGISVAGVAIRDYVREKGLPFGRVKSAPQRFLLEKRGS